MNVSVAPVTDGGLTVAMARLLRPEGRARSLTQPGSWHGIGCQGLGLDGSVEPETWGRIWQQSPVELAPEISVDRLTLGWEIVFRAGYQQNGLWALGSPWVREAVERAQTETVKSTLNKLDQAFRRVAGFEPDAEVGAPYATFLAGTDESRIPRLRTIVLFPTDHTTADGTRLAVPDRIMERCGNALERVYNAELTQRTLDAFGDFGGPMTRIPPGLFVQVEDSQLLNGIAANDHGLVPNGEECFTRWELRAALRGFGGEDLAALLDETQSRFCVNPLSPHPSKGDAGIHKRAEGKSPQHRIDQGISL